MSARVGKGTGGRGRLGRSRPHRRATVSTGVMLTAMIVVVSGLFALFGPAPPAYAHAVLVRSDPPAGAALATAPARVTLGFTEAVSVEEHAIRVLAESGERVDTGRATTGASASEVTVDVGSGPGLGRGIYVVTWRVVSADSHPISGAFAFGVGVTPATDAAARAASDETGSATVGVAAAVARFAGFAGTSLLLGACFFLVVLWPVGRASRRARMLVWAGWGMSVAATVALLLLQGLEVYNLGILDIADPDPLSATMQSRFGRLLAIRLVVLALAVPLLRTVFPRPGTAAAGAPTVTVSPPMQPWGKAELGALGVMIVMTTAAIGHAAAGELPWLATASYAVHVAAMAVWLGGLATLAVCLLRPRARLRPGGSAAAEGTGGVPGAGDAALPASRAADGADGADGADETDGADGADALARVLPRWSRTAMVAVIMIVATGMFQSWREVGSLPAVVATDYGRLLLAKTSVVVVMLGLGGMARRWVVRHRHSAVSARPRAGERSERLGMVAHALAGGGAPAPLAAPGELAVPAPQVSPDPSTPSKQPTGGREVVALRRGVFAEAALGAAALALTAVLVDTVPATTSYSPPFSDTVTAGPLTVDVQVEPTNRGAQAIDVYTFGSAGQVQPLEEAVARLSLPDAGVGPLEVPLVLAGPGHATAEGVQVPLPGVWQLRLTLRTGEFDQYVTTIFYEVR